MLADFKTAKKALHRRQFRWRSIPVSELGSYYLSIRNPQS